MADWRCRQSVSETVLSPTSEASSSVPRGLAVTEKDEAADRVLYTTAGEEPSEQLDEEPKVVVEKDVVSVAGKITAPTAIDCGKPARSKEGKSNFRYDDLPTVDLGQ